MPLSFWQELVYNLSFDVWKPAAQLSASFVATGDSYTKVGTAVRMQQVSRDSTLSPESFGRAEADNMFSMDEFHCASDVDIDADYYLKNVTAGHVNNGIFYVVRGNPSLSMDVAGVAMARKVFMASREETAPTGIS